MELSKYLRDYSKTVAGKEQLIIAAVAEAMEVIPRQLCDNAGFDSMNILNRLRQKHAEGDPLLSFLLYLYLHPSLCLVMTYMFVLLAVNNAM